MEFKEDFIQKIGLTEDQVKALSEETNNHETVIRKNIESEWETKSINDAEGILRSVSKGMEEITGIKHEKGEKYVDYIKKATDLHFEGSKASLERQKTELEQKLKNHKGDEVLKQELKETKEKLDALQEKEAEFDEWKRENYKEKFLQAQDKLTKQEKSIAYGNVKPAIPDNVNKYEFDAKWKEFIQKTEEKFHIKVDDDNVGWAIDKENEHIRRKLSDLVKEDETISKLLAGRNVSGIGGETKKKVNFEGIPFELPENPTSMERQKAIKDYLVNVKKLDPMLDEYSKLYAELNQKILEKIPKKS